MKLRKRLAVSALLALAPTAALAAQDGRFSATLGFGALDSSADPAVSGPIAMPPMSHLEQDNDDTVLSGSFAWHVNDRWAIELWSSQGARQHLDIDVENAHDIAVAGYDVTPIALTAQYHFAPIHDRFKPFVGLGWHRTRASGVSSNPSVAEAAGLQVSGDSGFAAVAGVDMRWASTGSCAATCATWTGNCRR